MIKTVDVIVTNINKTKDKKYVAEIYNAIIDSIIDFDQCASKLYFIYEDSSFTISFKAKQCKYYDFLYVLIKEFLSVLVETEPQLDVTIMETEEIDNKISKIAVKVLSVQP